MSPAKRFAIGVGIGAAGTGLWAFFSPTSFYDFATYPPYNRHFVHDIGAFLFGVGATLVIATFASGAVFVAFAGAATGGWLHFISHVVDRKLGESGNRDLVLIGVLAVTLTAGAMLARRESSSG